MISNNPFLSKACTGCAACVSICPRNCITMVRNDEGFEEPHINQSECIHCRKCINVCPTLNQKKEISSENSFFFFRNQDEKVVLNSSSGGAFHIFAKQIIQEKGIVFGAKFNSEWEVIHDYTDTVDGISAFQGSKYVQSKIGLSFKKAKHFLDQGRIVLFSGAPCQVSGLLNYLGHEYANLFTIDFICHGVPSPAVFHRYITEKTDKNDKDLPSECSHIASISFRDKAEGWQCYSLSMNYTKKVQDEDSSSIIRCQYRKNLNDDLYLRGFIHNLFLRHSCSDCQLKSFSSGSDITLADAWGVWNITREWNDNKGCSLIISHGQRGKNLLFSAIPKDRLTTTDEKFVHLYNSAAYESARPHRNRKLFFRLFKKGDIPFSKIINRCLPTPSYFDKILWSINKRWKKIIGIGF